jgi:glycine hydroxymethyltransferase
MDGIIELLENHEKWRKECLNLCAAENAMSPGARNLLSSDLTQRYGDYTGRDLDSRRYFGTKEIIKLEKYVSSLAAEIFRARFVELRPLSGHIAGDSLILSLCRPGDLVLELSREAGGHRIATKLASAPLISLNVGYLPFNPISYNVDVEKTLAFVRNKRPRMIILGSSNFLFPHPIKELSYGLKEFPETILAYDASHVLGLIAGGYFQDPLSEGAQVVIAGTQKSFPGPQGGLIYGDDEELMRLISSAVYPSLISNHHLARLPSLGIALLEMKYFGKAYSEQVIKNAKALGASLVEKGIPVLAPDYGFTESHTILIPTIDIGNAEMIGRRLENANIIVNAVRLPEQLGGQALRIGVSEITRNGAVESIMEEVANILAFAIFERASLVKIRDDVIELSAKLGNVQFTF